MNIVVKNYAKYCDSLELALYAATGAVANSLKLPYVVFVRKGHKFDIVEVNQDMNVVAVHINGKLVVNQ